MEILHGCRSEYGPLELRVQAGASVNGFTVFVQDLRLALSAVYEHPAQSTLESAQESAVQRAGEYLTSRNEEPLHVVDWRCS